MRIIKINNYPGENVTDFWDAILVYAELLESAGYFNPDHLGYTTCNFENTSDSRFHLCATHKYKDVMEFINKRCVCDKYVMQSDDIITYVSLVQYDIREYHTIFDSNRWEPNDSNKKFQHEPLLLKAPTKEIENLVNKTADKVDFKSRHNGK